MSGSKTDQRVRRHQRLRRKVAGTTDRPRLQIQRSLHHLYAFVVDDSNGHTLVAASTREKDVAAGLASRTLTYGLEPGADVTTRKPTLSLSGLEFTVATPPKPGSTSGQSTKKVSSCS